MASPPSQVRGGEHAVITADHADRRVLIVDADSHPGTSLPPHRAEPGESCPGPGFEGAGRVALIAVNHRGLRRSGIEQEDSHEAAS